MTLEEYKNSTNYKTYLEIFNKEDNDENLACYLMAHDHQLANAANLESKCNKKHLVLFIDETYPVILAPIPKGNEHKITKTIKGDLHSYVERGKQGIANLNNNAILLGAF